MKSLMTTMFIVFSFSAFAGQGSLLIETMREETFRTFVDVSESIDSDSYIPLITENNLRLKAKKSAKTVVVTEAQEFCQNVLGKEDAKVKVKSVKAKISNIGSDGDNGYLLQCGRFGFEVYCSGNALVEFVCK